MCRNRSVSISSGIYFIADLSVIDDAEEKVRQHRLQHADLGLRQRVSGELDQGGQRDDGPAVRVRHVQLRTVQSAVSGALDLRRTGHESRSP